MWISAIQQHESVVYTLPSWTSPQSPTPLGHQGRRAELPVPVQWPHTGHRLCTQSCTDVNATVPILSTFSFPCCVQSLSSMCASLFLPWGTIYNSCTGKQPRCPSTEKWVENVWYINTMEYYSAIKRNAFASVLVRRMNSEPVQFSSVQSLSCVRLSVTPWIAACQATAAQGVLTGSHQEYGCQTQKKKSLADL